MGLVKSPEAKLNVKNTFLEYDDKALAASPTASSLTRCRSQTEPAIDLSFGDVPQNAQGSEASSSSSHGGGGSPFYLKSRRPDYDASRSSIVMSTPEFTPMHFPTSRHMPELLQADWPESLLPEAWFGPEAMANYCQWNEQYGQYGWWAPDQFAAMGYGQHEAGQHKAGNSILNQVPKHKTSPKTSPKADRTSAPSIKQEVPKASVSTIAVGAVKETRSTVMLRDLPEAYSRSRLLKLLEAQGFFGRFDFVYLPVDFKHQKNLGYALINLVSPAEALRLTSHFEGFSTWDMPSEMVCTVGWCSPQQGLAAHVERYRNSPVMHESVPEEWRPMLLSHGVPIPFPEPTIKIKAPKVKGRQS